MELNQLVDLLKTEIHWRSGNKQKKMITQIKETLSNAICRVFSTYHQKRSGTIRLL